MHQRAAEADLIIVNHHLFFADLALRQDDFGSVLPEYGAVIFDEAHEIEDVASDYFGRQISNYRFEELARDAEAGRAHHASRAAPALLRRVIAHARARRAVFLRPFRRAKAAFRLTPAQRAAFPRAEPRGLRRAGRTR